MFEAMLPMHRHFWISFLVCKKKSAIPVYDTLMFRRLPVLYDCPEALRHIIRHRQFPGSCIGLGAFNNVLHFRWTLQLMVDVDYLVFHINVWKRQAAEFWNPHACMEKDVDHFIILAVHHIIMDKFQKFSHLVFCHCFACYAVIYHYPCKFKPKGVFI